VKLTIELWRELVANHLRRAWLSMWSDATDVEMDYAGERLVEDGWTVSRATWCVKQVVREAYSPKGIMASLSKADTGTRDRDGNIMGGWLQSKVYRDEIQKWQDTKLQRECYTAYRDCPDWEPRCTRQKGFCDGCPGIEYRYSPGPARRTGERFDNPGFKRVGEIAQGVVDKAKEGSGR